MGHGKGLGGSVEHVGWLMSPVKDIHYLTRPHAASNASGASGLPWSTSFMAQEVREGPTHPGHPS